MYFEQDTLLFGDLRLSVATEGDSEYGHTFGGQHDRDGGSREECGGVLIHLLHRLNLADPAVPFSIPGTHWLPLYYVFDFRANRVGYRLESEERMEVFFPVDDPHVSDEEEWPSDDAYPEVFPSRPIRVDKANFKPKSIKHARGFTGVFGIDHLSARVRAKLLREAAAEVFDPEMLPALHELEEEKDELLTAPFAQARPTGPCLDRECNSHRGSPGLSPLAVMSGHPVKGVQTFGPASDFIQIIASRCQACGMIVTDNQCT